MGGGPLAARGQSMAHIFISYARKDAEAANRMVGTLANAGYEAWIDREIPGGELWKKRIVEAIDKSHAFLILLSPNSVASENVRKELDIAELRKKLIFPLVIAPMKVPAEMEYSLVGLQRIDFVTDPNSGERNLLSAMRRLRALDEQNVDWTPWMDTEEGRKTLNAILTDPSRSIKDKINDHMMAADRPSDGAIAWQKKMADADGRHAATSAELENLREQELTLLQEVRSTSSPEIKKLIMEELDDIQERIGSLMSEREALRQEEMSLVEEGSRERDKIMERSRKMLEETNKLIERVWGKKEG
jgi:hypothetical protein